MFNAQDYYRENRERILARSKTYYQTNRAMCLEKSKQYYRQKTTKCVGVIARQRIARPWLRHLDNARRRCEVPTTNKYKYYGGAGIKCLLTVDEIEQLWNRDHAISLKQPSIDRKDSTRDYTFDNCQFIEFEQNRMKRDYGKPNMKCRECEIAFRGNGTLNTCRNCRREEQARNTEYPKAVNCVRDAALAKGLRVEPVFLKSDKVRLKNLKINDLIIAVHYSSKIWNHNGYKYSHFNKPRREIKILCLVRKIGQRYDIFLCPNSVTFKITQIFIPIVLSENKIGRKPSVDWMKFRDAWHLFNDIPK